MIYIATLVDDGKVHVNSDFCEKIWVVKWQQERGENAFVWYKCWGKSWLFDLDITKRLLTKLFWVDFVRKFKKSF